MVIVKNAVILQIVNINSLTMGIKEFFELQNEAFGKLEHPVVSCHYYGFQFDDPRDRYQNYFIFTGAPSVAVAVDISYPTNYKYVPFNNFINIDELRQALGTNNRIRLVRVEPIFSGFRDIVYNNGSNQTVVHGADNTSFSVNQRCRYYLVRYNFNKILEIAQ